MVCILLAIILGNLMRELVAAVVRELDLDDVVSLVSGRASLNYEIVMWGRPHNTYFSSRLNWGPLTPDDPSPMAFSVSSWRGSTTFDADVVSSPNAAPLSLLSTIARRARSSSPRQSHRPPTPQSSRPHHEPSSRIGAV